MSDSLRPHGLEHTRLPYLLLALRTCSNSCPLSQWCYPTISSSVTPFSSCPQSFPVSGSFLMSQLFASGGQSIGASVSASVLPVNIQDWFPLGLIGFISLLSRGPSRVFFNTTMCACKSLSQGGFQQRPMGRLSITLFLTCKEFTSQERFLDFENDKYIVSYLGTAQPPLSIPCCWYFGVSVHKESIPNAYLVGGEGASTPCLTCTQASASLTISSDIMDNQ